MNPQRDPILDGDLSPRAARALEAILRALVITFAVMVVVAAVFFTVPVAASLGGFVIAVVGLRIALARGHLAVACYGLVASMVTLGLAATVAYGSIRGTQILAFVSAVILAGIFVGRRALIATVAASSACLAALVYAERAGWLLTPELAVGPAQWFIHSLALSVMALSLYYARGTAVGAVRRMRSSEEGMATLFQASPAALIISTRQDGRIVDINKTYERTFATRRENAIGRTVLQLGLWANPADRERFVSIIQRDGRAEKFEAVLVRRDGTQFEALLSAEVMDGESGPLILGVVTDISAEKRASEAIRLSERRFRQMFESSPVGMVITRASDGVFIDTNPADEQTLGYTREEVVGKTALEIGSWASDEDRAVFVSRLRGERIVQGFETPMINKAGEPVVCRISASLVDLNGEECVLSSIVNVTEQKRAAEREHQLRSKFEALFETSPEGIAVTRVKDAVLIEANDAACAQLGLDRATAIGRSVIEMGIGAAKSDETEIFGKLRADGRLTNRATRFRNARGEWMDFLLSAVVLKLDERACVVWSWRNVTELRRAEQAMRDLNETLERRVEERTTELESANRELESYSYSVSHDLRAPLRAIAGFSAVIREKFAVGLPSQALHYFQRIEQNAEQMRRLIDDLLGLARTGRVSLVRSRVDMRQLAQSVITELSHQSPHRAEVVVHPMPDAIGDAVLLSQVWRNLIGNALKFSRQVAQPHVEVGSEVADGTTWYYVRDNGAGFDMAYVDKLFGTFQRLHTDAEFEGTGVGLAIVKRIVDRHGGLVRAESGTSAGASFLFSVEAPPGD